MFELPAKRCRKIKDEEAKEEEQPSGKIPVLGNDYDGWLSPLYDLNNYLKKRDLKPKNLEKQLFTAFIHMNPDLLGNAKGLRLPSKRLSEPP